MKRFILSAFSVLLATSAVAYEAQALPKVDPSFEIQTLRLREFDSRNKAVSSLELQKLRLQEFDTRNKSEDYPAPYYPEASSQNATSEQESAQSTESTQWKNEWENEWEDAENQEEWSSTELSLIERRHQALDID
ncbi:MAG: hypothetical protein AAFQ63_08140 [Cyanobacteria bacterium J06621_11]